MFLGNRHLSIKTLLKIFIKYQNYPLDIVLVSFYEPIQVQSNHYGETSQYFYAEN